MHDEQHYDRTNDAHEKRLWWDPTKQKRYNRAGQDDESPFREQKVKNGEANYDAECVSAIPVSHDAIEGT